MVERSRRWRLRPLPVRSVRLSLGPQRHPRSKQPDSREFSSIFHREDFCHFRSCQLVCYTHGLDADPLCIPDKGIKTATHDLFREIDKILRHAVLQQTCEPVKTMLDALLAKTRPVARHVRVTSARSMLDFTMALILAVDQQRPDRDRIVADLVVARRRKLAQLQLIERRLAGHRRAVRAACFQRAR